MKPLLPLFLLLIFFASLSFGQSAADTWSVKFSTAMRVRYTPTINAMTNKGWEYSNSTILHGMEKVFNHVPDSVSYLNYIRSYVDAYVDASGNVTGLTTSVDKIHPGILCLFLYEKLKGNAADSARYRNAAKNIRDYLIGPASVYPKNGAGGYWHKTGGAYNNVMMADGMYMAHPFLVKYGYLFSDPVCYDTATAQILLLASHLYDNTTHLFKHAWNYDVTTYGWADASTAGVSREVWSRGMGWLVMALADVLKYLPPSHTRYADIKDLLANLIIGIQSTQDPVTGLWYQVMDKAGMSGNFTETSGSAMFVYAIKTAVDSGWINASYLTVAQSAWAGLQAKISTYTDGRPAINDFAPAMSVQSSYAAYTSPAIAPVDCPTGSGTQHPHGYAAILMAASVMEFPLAVTLPVRFTSFTARPSGDKVLLQWKNPDDGHEVDYYHIQRSANGTDFNTIDKLKATGVSYYDRTDNQVTGNIIYYRIQAVSTNGAAYYSPVRVVKLKEVEPSMLVAPNPAKGGVISVLFQHIIPGEYTLSVVDHIGRSITVKKIQVKGDGTPQTIPLPATAPHGLYYVWLKAGDMVITRCVLAN